MERNSEILNTVKWKIYIKLRQAPPKAKQRHTQGFVATPWRDGNTLEREHLIIPVGIREGFTNKATLTRKVEEWNRIFQNDSLALKGTPNS